MRSNVQGSYSSNDSSSAHPAPLGIDISKASLEELEIATARSHASEVDWQTWEMVRELSTGRMRNADLDEATRLRWARLSLAAIRRKQETSDFGPASILADEVNVCVFAVREFGAVHGDAVRDPLELCRTVFREINESPEEVASAAEGWRSLAPQEILRLRHIKNLLTLLRPIVDFLPVSARQHQQVSEWLQLIPRLP